MLYSLDVGQPKNHCSLNRRLHVTIKMLMTMTLTISFSISMTMMRQGVQQQVASPGSERSVGVSADVGSICTLRVLVCPFYLGFNMYSALLCPFHFGFNMYSSCFGLPILFGVQYVL